MVLFNQFIKVYIINKSDCLKALILIAFIFLQGVWIYGQGTGVGVGKGN